MTALLDAAFVRELEALRKLLRSRARSGQSGGVTAARAGSSAEFEEHRSYVPGDDAQRIDWLAFARTGLPVRKHYRADEDTVVRVLVDASASLGFGQPRKLDVAVRVAASVAYLALAASERTQLFVLSGADAGAATRADESRPRPSSLRVSASRRGLAALGAVLRELSALEPGGAADLPETVRRLVATSARPGFLLVVSDFLDPGPVVESLERARHAGHDVALVQILSAEELSPDLAGDLTLVDAETGESLDLTPGSPMLLAYERRLAGLFSALADFARKSGASYVRVAPGEPLARVTRRVLSRSID